MYNEIISSLLLILIITAGVLSSRTRRDQKEAFHNSPIVVMYFYQERCPACRRFAPEWERFAEMAPPNVSVAHFDVKSVQNAYLVQQLGIQQTPTIYFQVNGQVIPYNGHHNAESILAEIHRLKQYANV